MDKSRTEIMGKDQTMQSNLSQNQQKQPDYLKKQLENFMHNQKKLQDANHLKTLTPAEIRRIDKAKAHIRQHFIKFFRQNSVKKNKVYFLKWKARVQLEQHIENKFLETRKVLMNKKKHIKKLVDEKNKQESKILLNCF